MAGQPRTGPAAAGSIEVDHAGGGQPRTGHRADGRCEVDPRRIARLASQQGGVVARHQLVALGVGRRTIDHWVTTGHLTVLHRGVYAVGHTAISAGGRNLAALLAGGEHAVLSHRSAAAAWRLRPEPAIPEITVVGARRSPRPDLAVHAVTAFLPSEVRRLRGLRLTSPTRTLLDLATVVPQDDLDRAVAEAQVLRLVTDGELRAAAPLGHRGRAALRRALDGAGGAPTRTELERAMLRLIRDAGLPRPQVNTIVAGHEADFAWPQHRLIVETDGWSAHGDRRAFERDRARDLEHQAAGWTVLRLSWRQIVEQPLLVAARLGRLLGGVRP